MYKLIWLLYFFGSSFAKVAGYLWNFCFQKQIRNKPVVSCGYLQISGLFIEETAPKMDNRDDNATHDFQESNSFKLLGTNNVWILKIPFKTNNQHIQQYLGMGMHPPRCTGFLILPPKGHLNFRKENASTAKPPKNPE